MSRAYKLVYHHNNLEWHAKITLKAHDNLKKWQMSQTHARHMGEVNIS